MPASKKDSRIPKPRIHNGDKLRNAAFIFVATYGVFSAYNKQISPRWPKYNRHLYVAGKRVHHYETGLYLVALGLALFIEDLKDWHE